MANRKLGSVGNLGNLGIFFYWVFFFRVSIFSGGSKLINRKRKSRKKISEVSDLSEFPTWPLLIPTLQSRFSPLIILFHIFLLFFFLLSLIIAIIGVIGAARNKIWFCKANIFRLRKKSPVKDCINDHSREESNIT